MFRKTAVVAVALCSLMLIACESEGPAENAGEAIDNAAEELSDAGKDLGNAVEDACEDVKQGAGAQHTDC